MIPFERSRQQTIPNSSVKIIGVGGAGANMLDRVALDGMDGAELLAANTDLRTLTSSVSAEKIQMGRSLTKGLGAGGDPALGRQAASEAELELRDSLRDRKIVFICVGLGGGTGSGAAPLIARLAREEGAFTVVFATMPFAFEGKRRQEQAGTALNELAVLANALVTFDNGRMGDLILAKQGVHEAFAAADRMVSEAIRAVTRIVLRPGLINIGLDDLMSALSSNRSRCLFGSGLAEGENRAQQALKNALVSPLLDRGSLLADAQTVLVHICGGEDLTLYEIELLMRGLAKHVPETAQLLFGTAVDPAMQGALSVTLVSSLPEEALQIGTSGESAGASSGQEDLGVEAAIVDHEPPAQVEAAAEAQAEEPRSRGRGSKSSARRSAPARAPRKMERTPPPAPAPAPVPEPVVEAEAPVEVATPEASEETAEAPFAEGLSEDGAEQEQWQVPSADPALSNVTRRVKLPPKRSGSAVPNLDDVFSSTEENEEPQTPVAQIDEWEESDVEPVDVMDVQSAPESDPEADGDVVAFSAVEPGDEALSEGLQSSIEELQAAAGFDPKPQGELALDGGPKGRFEGEEPNLVGGEDLDVPPFLRRKK